MKVLKIIIGIVVLVAVLGLGYLAMLPGDYTIEREIEINAPQAFVMEHVANYTAWDNWSPWKAKDPNAKYTYEGSDGAVGSKMSWVTSLPPEDKNQIGEGGLTMVSVSENNVEFTLAFVKPWEMSSVNGFDLSEADGVTKVRWYDKGELSFFARPVGKMMDEMVGPDFEEGLAKLKAHVEEQAATKGNGYTVEQITVEAAPYYSITDSVAREEIESATQKMMGGLMEFVSSNSIEIAGAPFTIYHTWDGVSTKMQCGITVADNSTAGSDGIEKGMTYAGNALKTVMLGSYENGEEPHNAIAEYAKANEIEITGAPWEVYLVGPGTEEDPSKWVTEIYYPIN